MKTITTLLIVVLLNALMFLMLRLTFEPSYYFILASIFGPVLTYILLMLDAIQ